MKYPPDLPPASVQRLWEGCILVTIAEAFDSALSGSAYWIGTWDGPDYRLDNESGDLGTICFRGDSLVALCFGHASQRSPWRYPENAKPLEWYLPDLPDALSHAVDQSAVPFLRSRTDGERRAPVTATFWGSGGDFFALEPWSDVFWNGAFLLETELRHPTEATRQLVDRYEFSRDVGALLTEVATRKFRNPESETVISSHEQSVIIGSKRLQETVDQTADLSEAQRRTELCRELLAQINVKLV